VIACVPGDEGYDEMIKNINDGDSVFKQVNSVWF
jgi:hypothetical protein